MIQKFHILATLIIDTDSRVWTEHQIKTLLKQRLLMSPTEKGNWKLSSEVVAMENKKGMTEAERIHERTTIGDSNSY